MFPAILIAADSSETSHYTEMWLNFEIHGSLEYLSADVKHMISLSFPNPSSLNRIQWLWNTHTVMSKRKANKLKDAVCYSNFTTFS